MRAVSVLPPVDELADGLVARLALVDVDLPAGGAVVDVAGAAVGSFSSAVLHQAAQLSLP